MIMLEYSNMMPFNHRNGICFSRFLDLKVFSFDQTFSKSLSKSLVNCLRN